MLLLLQSVDAEVDDIIIIMPSLCDLQTQAQLICVGYLAAEEVEKEQQQQQQQ